MRILHDIATQLLLEQDSKIDIIKKAIEERIPLSIYYRGPAHEVREGQRIDIEPVVMGRHIRSGNLVIWNMFLKVFLKEEYQIGKCLELIELYQRNLIIM